MRYRSTPERLASPLRWRCDSDHKNALFYRVAGCRRHPIAAKYHDVSYDGFVSTRRLACSCLMVRAMRTTVGEPRRRGSDLEGREAGGPPGPVAHDIRIGHQSEDRQGARP